MDPAAERNIAAALATLKDIKEAQDRAKRSLELACAHAWAGGASISEIAKTCGHTYQWAFQYRPTWELMLELEQRRLDPQGAKEANE